MRWVSTTPLSAYNKSVPYKDPDVQRRYQRERCARIRAEWFAGKSCVDCGTRGNLEIDHVEPALKVSHRVWSWSEVRRLTELAKCVVRCAPCHDSKTYRNNEYLRGEAHGSSKYTEETVKYVRAQRTAGVRLKDLVEQLGIPKQTIWGMCNDKWKHVT